jgi:GT2 family glycosyltransferase
MILLLNSDAFLSESAIDQMVRKMDEYPDTGALGCRLLYEDETLQRSCQSFPGLETELWQAFFLGRVFSANRIFGKYKMTYWKMDDFREVDVVMGAVLLVRCSALDQIGLLDESFFMYSEEVDLCYRLKKQGWKVRFMPEAQAIHLWGGSSRKVPAATMVRLYRSRVQFFRKHYGGVKTFLFKGILCLESIMRIFGGYLGYVLLRKEGLLQLARGYRQVMEQVRAF